MGNSWTVTFDAKDGDVAQLSILKKAGSDNSFSVHTKHNGWSIEAPVSMGLDTMQAGGIVNVTAKEVCTFTETGGTGTVGYYCYDGVCGPASTDGTGDEAQVALRLIKDDNGDAILGTAAIAETTATDPKTVTMPLGKSCDGLELRGTTNAITKAVDKHNNGKQFKITRSFLQRSLPAGMTTTVGAVTFTQGASLLSAVANVDSIIIGDKATCGAAVAAIGDEGYPISRIIDKVNGNVFGAVSSVVSETPATISAAGVVALVSNDVGYAVDSIATIYGCTDVPAANGVYRVGANAGGGTDITLKSLTDGSAITTATIGVGDNTGCTIVNGLAITDTDTATKCYTSFGRHVITLDSMPGLSTYKTLKSLQYTSPVGSCSVSETTKGTYESYECSNRGACDGKSGLCTCYEG